MSLVQHRDGADCRECLTQLHCPSPGLQVLPPQQPPKPPDQSGSISRGSECTATGHLLLPAPPPNPMSTRALSPTPGVTSEATINQQVSGCARSLLFEDLPQCGGFSGCGAQALRARASAVAALTLSSRGSRAPEHRLNSYGT
ncbi:hypothetical protein MJT46_008523 [Ovis ammon polii x Ovis aries]|nr:hypothetical protein MJT46_008523 [Ovis ammon polii x Ovis aries]